MRYPRLLIKRENLEKAVRYSGKSEDEARKRFSWYANEKNPTLKQLKDFAKFTYVPFAILLLDEMPTLGGQEKDFLDFRGKDTGMAFSPNLVDTVNETVKKQEWISEYRESEGYSEVNFPTLCKDMSYPKACEIMRDALLITWEEMQLRKDKENLFKYLVEKIESMGGIVFISGVVADNPHRPLAVSEFRGFCIPDTYAPVIFINNNDAKAAKIFTLVHELTHLFLGHKAISADPFERLDLSEEEQFCDNVAGEFLMPQHPFLEAFRDRKGEETVYHYLAHVFKVSEPAVYVRLYRLGQLGRKEYVGLFKRYNEIMKQHKNSSGGGNYYATKKQRVGSAFGKAVVTAARARDIGYGEAYRLLGVGEKVFSRLANEWGMGE